jgi:hypothetical protein
VIVREAYVLDVSVHVFFTWCWIQVIEWDFGVSKLLLLPCRIHIHAVYIECILSIASMCRRSIKDKNSNTIQICVLKDCEHVLDLSDQLGEVLSRVKPFPWIYYLAGFNRGKTELFWKFKLLSDLLLRELQLSDHLAYEV